MIFIKFNCNQDLRKMDCKGRITMKEIEEVYLRLFSRLCVFAEKILNDSESAKSTVQEVFLLFCEKKENFKIQESFDAYLIKAVYNKCLLHRRRIKIRQKHLDRIYYEKILENIPDEIFNRETILKLKIIDGAINSLPEQCKRIFLLHKKEGLSYAEIATLYGISVKTVGNHIYKAMRKIKEYIGKVQCQNINIIK